MLYNKGEITVNLPSGMGDILFLLSFLENAGDECGSYVVNTAEVNSSLLDLFPSLSRKCHFNKDHLHSYFLRNGADISPKQLWLKKCQHFLQGMSALFPQGLSPRRDIQINAGDQKIFDLFNSLSCEGRKTVLIFPHATSVPLKNVSDEYWVNYAKKLEQHGFNPIFNSKEKFDSFNNIFLNIRETVIFAKLAGNIIAVRSGIIDVLLYFTRARAIVLYPNQPELDQEEFIENFWDNPSKRQMEYFSLKKIFTEQAQDIQELIFDENRYVIWD
ncbi:MAG: hypothetical protein LUD39_05225 [Opitutae bacterium]|nr:hypothetical protein [Opitutae bacterium]